MPKRVHSASDRDDTNESTSTSKRTRKGTELVCQFYSAIILFLYSFYLKNNLCQEFYDSFRSYKSEDGRSLCEHFIRLPAKRFVLKKPNSFYF